VVLSGSIERARYLHAERAGVHITVDEYRSADCDIIIEMLEKVDLGDCVVWKAKKCA
jgi:hypothetical protein